MNEQEQGHLHIGVSVNGERLAGIWFSSLDGNALQVDMAYCCVPDLLVVRDALYEAQKAVDFTLWKSGIRSERPEGMSQVDEDTAPF